MDNMSLRYDPVTRKTYNRQGVQIRAQSNRTAPLERMSSNHSLPGDQLFNIFVQHLVGIGYERNKNLLGAGYDFRKAPNELGEYFENLTKLVEVAYSENSYQPVIIVCHSTGCMNPLHFLKTASKSWKSYYISSLVLMSPANGGTVNQLNQLVAGASDLALLPNLKRTDTPTWPSAAYLMPSPAVYPADQVLVQDVRNQYTTQNYERLYSALQYPAGYEIYLSVKDLTPPRCAPGFVVHCPHGYGTKTID